MRVSAATVTGMEHFGITTAEGWASGYRTAWNLIVASSQDEGGAPDYGKVRVQLALLSSKIQSAWTSAAESDADGMTEAAARGMTQLWVAERILDGLERLSQLDHDSIPLLPEPVQDLWETQCEQAWQDVFDARDIAPVMTHCARWETLITAWLHMVESVSLMTPPAEKPRRRWFR